MMALSVALAIVFLAATLFALVLLLRSDLPLIAKMTASIFIAGFCIVAFVLASQSPASPFSVSRGTPFGVTDEGPLLLIAVLGAVLGVVGSYFFQLGRKKIRWRSFIQPLAVSPITLIPTVELVRATVDPGFVDLMLLFALSYQNGFFWERLLGGETKTSDQGAR